MGFFVFLFIVCLIIFMVFIFMGNADHKEVQKEIAISMYGGAPVINKPEPSDEELLRNANAMMAKIEALIQADEAGHEDVYKQLEDNTYTGPMPERRSDGGWTSMFDDLRILSIAGINHRQAISHYKGRNTVALVPEPKNEFDPNAIKVVAEDGHHLGYIHQHQTDMVRSWAHHKFPFYCIARIEEHDDEDDGHRFYTGYLYILLK